MVLRTSLCAHCRSQAAVVTCRHCGSIVCERCAADETTCAAPRARLVGLGLGRRLRRVDPQARLGLVAGWIEGLRIMDLATSRRFPTECRLPWSRPLISSIARTGRVVWPYTSLVPDPRQGIDGLVVASVHHAARHELAASAPFFPRDLDLCPTGRYVWGRTKLETVYLWDVERYQYHEHDPLPGSVLQAAALHGARNLLATSTYGRAAVHRFDGAALEPLGMLRLRDADNVWIGISDRCLAVISDLRGARGSVLRAFALDATGVPEREPFYVHADREAAAGRSRDVHIRRPVVAALSRDGGYLAVATEDNDIAVHDLTRGRVQYLDREDGHVAGRLALLAFDDTADALLSSDADGRVIVRPRRDHHFLQLAPDQR
jgi:hypothetical protein